MPLPGQGRVPMTGFLPSAPSSCCEMHRRAVRRGSVDEPGRSGCVDKSWSPGSLEKLR